MKRRRWIDVVRFGLIPSLLTLLLLGAMAEDEVPHNPVLLTTEVNLLQENFESYPTPGIPLNGGWEIVWGGAGDNTVTDVCAVSPTRSLQLRGRPGWSAVVEKRFSSSASVIGYEYAIRIAAVGSGGPGRAETPGFFSREAAEWGRYYATVSFDHDGRVVMAEDGTILGAWEPGCWYRIKVILDRRTNRYDIWLDERLVGPGIATRHSDTNSIASLALFSGHPGVAVFYDDVRVFEVVGEQLRASEWNIDFQGDGSHNGTYGQTGPAAHVAPGTHWNILEVPSLRQPWPTPCTRYATLDLRDSTGQPGSPRFSILGDAYGWAGWQGRDSLVDDYLIIRNDFGVTNNPMAWYLTGLIPDTDYVLTYYHHDHDLRSDRGILFVANGVSAQVTGVPGQGVATATVTSDQAGRIEGSASASGFSEGDWAALTVRSVLPATGDYGDAPDTTFPSSLAGGGPCHLDAHREWIGTPGEPRPSSEGESQQVDADDDGAEPQIWRSDGATWLSARVSYDPAGSAPDDPRYLNVLIDIDGNGSWDGGDEWAVRNVDVPFRALPRDRTTLVMVVRIPDRVDPAALRGHWIRVTLSSAILPDGSGAWGILGRGETEDHRYSGQVALAMPKVQQVVAGLEIEGKRKPDAAETKCPHGSTGALLRGGTSPYVWFLGLGDIVPSMTVEMRLRDEPSCRCTKGCHRLIWESHLTSPDKTAFSSLGAFFVGMIFNIDTWTDITPPNLGFAGGHAINLIDGEFWFEWLPGHDCVVVEVRYILDPDDDFVCIQTYVDPVMMLSQAPIQGSY